MYVEFPQPDQINKINSRPSFTEVKIAQLVFSSSCSVAQDKQTRFKTAKFLLSIDYFQGLSRITSILYFSLTAELKKIVTEDNMANISCSFYLGHTS